MREAVSRLLDWRFSVAVGRARAFEALTDTKPEFFRSRLRS
jgi:hypothetical protein